MLPRDPNKFVEYLLALDDVGLILFIRRMRTKHGRLWRLFCSAGKHKSLEDRMVKLFLMIVEKDKRNYTPEQMRVVNIYRTGAE